MQAYWRHICWILANAIGALAALCSKPQLQLGQGLLICLLCNLNCQVLRAPSVHGVPGTQCNAAIHPLVVPTGEAD